MGIGTSLIDDDTFRAVARSSPWRWMSVELTRRLVEPSPRYGDIHAWIRRPRLMRMEEAGRPPHVVDDSRDPGAGRGYFGVSTNGRVSELAPPPLRFPQNPSAPAPVRRDDGLVAARPDSFDVVYDDPMAHDYQWVAMLDPYELADGIPDDDGVQRPEVSPIDVVEVNQIEREGRATLAAVVRPTPAYDPRCACCPLLYCALADEYEDQPVREASFYADAFHVQLDLQTGICVMMREIGGERPDTGFDVTIHEVDAEYPDTLFR